MIASTGWLFRRLLGALRIDIVCDVGSMNGRDALAFREAVPQARLYAFEANPFNVSTMRADRRLARCAIEIVPSAVANVDGEADFYIVAAPGMDSAAWRGMSSLYRREASSWFDTSTARVTTLRLDTFFAGRAHPGQRAALWIDVEGKGYEVIEGARNLNATVQIIHVEVETTPCIASAQRLYAQVKALLTSQGFVEIATDASPLQVQFNALYVRAAARVADRCRIAFYLMLAWMRAFAGRVIRRFCPAYLHYRQRRLAAARARAA
jgi:FkbM family methyltransferase